VGPPRRNPEDDTSPPSILIVDDDHDLREGLRFVLEAEHFTVLEASNGSEALALLVGRQTATPRLVWLDLQMPVMSGSEFLAVTRKNTNLTAVPVIVSSGLRPDPQILRQPGVVAWAQKPCAPDDLIRLVRAHVARGPLRRPAA
jgi:CheY-like chemotaxis protein